jgi:hypothetical protein
MDRNRYLRHARPCWESSPPQGCSKLAAERNCGAFFSGHGL